ncbi:hypothetical protein H4W31_007125 [Plantactinospora soyae]|uniref:Uncharacterized protein n=1 Tax=Plantactinospora soyae TaxID=1544732 RepID=A0A927MCZ3_9ACTN|nr:hypothetical protein [Plantactinospora soyae]
MGRRRPMALVSLVTAGVRAAPPAVGNHCGVGPGAVESHLG